MINNCIIIRITGNVEQAAEDIITTEWAKYNREYTTVKIPGDKNFIETVEQVYSTLGEIIELDFIK